MPAPRSSGKRVFGRNTFKATLPPARSEPIKSSANSANKYLLLLEGIVSLNQPPLHCFCDGRARLRDSNLPVISSTLRFTVRSLQYI